jgi:hypothetical protein
MVTRTFLKFLLAGVRLFKTLRKSGRIYQALQLQLLGAKLLFQLILQRIVLGKLIEKAIVGAAQVNGEYQNRRKIKNNKNKTKLGHHMCLLFFTWYSVANIRYSAPALPASCPGGPIESAVSNASRSGGWCFHPSEHQDSV